MVAMLLTRQTLLDNGWSGDAPPSRGARPNDEPGRDTGTAHSGRHIMASVIYGVGDIVSDHPE